MWWLVNSKAASGYLNIPPTQIVIFFFLSIRNVISDESDNHVTKLTYDFPSSSSSVSIENGRYIEGGSHDVSDNMVDENID